MRMARSTIPMQYKMRKTSAKCGHVLSLYVLTSLYFQDARDIRGGEGEECTQYLHYSVHFFAIYLQRILEACS